MSLFLSDSFYWALNDDISCFISKLTGFHLLCRNRGISLCYRGILPPHVEGAVSRNLSNGNCHQIG